MATSTIKKISFAGTDNHHASPAMRKPLLQITEFTELGDGYAIVKTKANTDQLRNFFSPSAPPTAIPITRINQLLNSYLREDDRMLDSANNASTSKQKIEPTENQLFMQKFMQEEANAYAEMLKNGTLLLPDVLWQRLAISRQAISKAIQEKRMFAIAGPNGKMLYPAFFADPKYDRRQLAKVSQALGDLAGSSKFQFFTTGKMSLAGKTPLEALAAGDLQKVLVTAAGFVER